MCCCHQCCCYILVQAIPKLLWDLGPAKPATTHTALALLHTALRFAPVGSALSSALDSLQPQLCPLYCSILAPKSSKSPARAAKNGTKAAKVVVPGPLAQLPVDSQVGCFQRLSPAGRQCSWCCFWCSGTSIADLLTDACVPACAAVLSSNQPTMHA